MPAGPVPVEMEAFPQPSGALWRLRCPVGRCRRRRRRKRLRPGLLPGRLSPVFGHDMGEQFDSAPGVLPLHAGADLRHGAFQQMPVDDARRGDDIAFLGAPVLCRPSLTPSDTTHRLATIDAREHACL